MAKAKGVRAGGGANSDRRTGGLSKEFSRSRDTSMGRSSRLRDGDPGQILGASAIRSAPFNGSNVYGILTARTGDPKTNTGNAPRAAQGNAKTGGGRVSSGSLSYPTKGNPNSRGGSNSGSGRLGGAKGRGRRGR